jgi:hypothetical protein
VRERPILFSGSMVRALLAGTKTMTRRPMKAQPRVIPDWACSGVAGLEFDWGRGDVATYADRPETLASYADDFAARCPYGQPGDRLWARETWCRWYGGQRHEGEIANGVMPAGTVGVSYLADIQAPAPERKAVTQEQWATVKGHSVLAGFETSHAKWRPSIHMPRWASRLTLEVTKVRVQRLQEISEEDAKAEGVQPAPFCRSGRPAGMEHVEAFEDLWTSIYGHGSWESNPWIWAVSFRVLK